MLSTCGSNFENVQCMFFFLFFVQPTDTFKTLSDVGFRTRVYRGRGLRGHVAGSLLMSRTHKCPYSAQLRHPSYQSRCVRRKAARFRIVSLRLGELSSRWTRGDGGSVRTVRCGGCPGLLLFVVTGSSPSPPGSSSCYFRLINGFSAWFHTKIFYWCL